MQEQLAAMRSDIEALKGGEGEAWSDVRRQQQQLKKALEEMRTDHKVLPAVICSPVCILHPPRTRAA